MAKYDLDESKQILNIFNGNNPSKVLCIGDRVAVKHYSMFDYTNAFVIDLEEETVKLKFRSSLPELDFFPTDPIVLNFITEDSKLHILSGDISTILSIDPLILLIKIHKLEKKNSMRKCERFYVSLAARLDNVDSTVSAFAIVKNLSLNGFKMNCRENFDLESFVSLTVVVDNYYNISCKGKVVRKIITGNSHEYGIEILDMSQTNQLTFQHYINQLKTYN